MSSFEYPLTKPHNLAATSRRVFHALRVELGADCLVHIGTEFGGERDSEYWKLFRNLSATADKLYRYVAETYPEREYKATWYSFNTHAVTPTGRDNGLQLHRDGEYAEISAASGDTYSTEFLVEGTNPHPDPRSLITQDANYALGYSVDGAAFDKGHLEIFRPRPRAIAVLDGHIHQPPMPPTATNRTWYRIAFTYKEL